MYDDDFEGLTFEPDEFAMRFAPPQDDDEAETPQDHLRSFGYTVNVMNKHGIIFSPDVKSATERLREYFDLDPSLTFCIELYEIDDDQDIIEIM